MKHLPPTENQILQSREAKPPHLPLDQPVEALVESEVQLEGSQASILTLFLNVKECPLRCTMCDLWKPMPSKPVSASQLIGQVETTISQHPQTDQLKLYNSGNFFDSQSIPPEAYSQLAVIASRYERLIIENHPQVGWNRFARFTELLSEQTQLEVAMGLEIADDECLQWLNKRLTCEQFRSRCEWLKKWGVDIRAFVLLKPPPIESEQKGIELAIQTIDFAWDCGVETISLIPTRATTSFMKQLQQQGAFSPPSLASLEEVLKQASANLQGRLFVDLWDLDSLYPHETDFAQRMALMENYNLTQRWPDE